MSLGAPGLNHEQNYDGIVSSGVSDDLQEAAIIGDEGDGPAPMEDGWEGEPEHPEFEDYTGVEEKAHALAVPPPVLGQHPVPGPVPPVPAGPVLADPEVLPVLENDGMEVAAEEAGADPMEVDGGGGMEVDGGGGMEVDPEPAQDEKELPVPGAPPAADLIAPVAGHALDAAAFHALPDEPAADFQVNTVAECDQRLNMLSRHTRLAMYNGNQLRVVTDRVRSGLPKEIKKLEAELKVLDQEKKHYERYAAYIEEAEHVVHIRTKFANREDARRARFQQRAPRRRRLRRGPQGQPDPEWEPEEEEEEEEENEEQESEEEEEEEEDSDSD